MHNLGDDRELDRLSREAAGRYTPPGAPDWNALSTQLDQVMPVEEKKRRRVFFWWLLPLLVAGLAAGYWFLGNGEPGDVTTSSQNNATPADHNGQNAGGKDEAATTAPVGASNGAIVTTKEQPANSELTISQPSNTANLNINRNGVNRNGSRSTTNTQHAINTGTISTVRTDKAKSMQGVVAGNTGSPVQNANNGQTEAAAAKPLANLTVAPGMPTDPKTAGELKTNDTKTNETKKDETHTGETDPAGSKEAVAENKPTVTDQPVAGNTPAGKKSKPLSARGKGFSFAVLAGVDESTVKFKYGNEAGYNVGAMIGYHFSDKFSIHSGGIFTQKNYKVAGADFTAPKGSWASYYKLETIEGDCRMWEVPLLARYTISQSNKNSVFLSTGLSSYFMTKENYTYEYYNSMGIPVVRNASYNSSDTHVMSILHLSAGFERRVGKTMSMIVEPYAKLPLGGVGFGSIRLSSFGLNFAVQYRQPSKR